MKKIFKAAAIATGVAIASGIAVAVYKYFTDDECHRCCCDDWNDWEDEEEDFEDDFEDDNFFDDSKEEVKEEKEASAHIKVE